MNSIKTVEGDRLDLICWKHYGSLDEHVVEQTLLANPKIAQNAILQAGISIVLPDIKPVQLEESLW